jgi:hypothetical protein
MTFDLELHGSIYYKERSRHKKMSASQFPLLALRERSFPTVHFSERAQQLRGYSGSVYLREKHRRAKKFQEPTFQKRRSKNIPTGAFGWERNSLALGVSSLRRRTTRCKHNQLLPLCVHSTP